MSLPETSDGERAEPHGVRAGTVRMRMTAGAVKG